MKKSYSGPESGKSARRTGWERRRRKGSIEIVDTSEPQSIQLRLCFEKPIQCENIVDFKLEGKEAATDVIWTMEGPNRYMSKLMQVFMDMDEMVGKDFEAGLANLRT